jgi:hypothetical protein
MRKGCPVSRNERPTPPLHETVRERGFFTRIRAGRAPALRVRRLSVYVDQDSGKHHENHPLAELWSIGSC